MARVCGGRGRAHMEQSRNRCVECSAIVRWSEQGHLFRLERCRCADAVSIATHTIAATAALPRNRQPVASSAQAIKNKRIARVYPIAAFFVNGRRTFISALEGMV